MKEKKGKELGEDATKYGEFVCSAYHWLSQEDQKKQEKKWRIWLIKIVKRKKKVRKKEINIEKEREVILNNSK